jgi:hypothetical protein
MFIDPLPRVPLFRAVKGVPRRCGNHRAGGVRGQGGGGGNGGDTAGNDSIRFYCVPQVLGKPGPPPH